MSDHAMAEWSCEIEMGPVRYVAKVNNVYPMGLNVIPPRTELHDRR